MTKTRVSDSGTNTLCRHALRRLIFEVRRLEPAISIPMSETLKLHDALNDGLSALVQYDQARARRKEIKRVKRPIRKET